MYEKYEPMKRYQTRIEVIRKIKQENWSVKKAVYHYGFNEATIYRWLGKWFYKGYKGLEDRSRRPKHIYQPTDWDIQLKIRTLRKKYGWCHQTIGFVLAAEGIKISPVTVYRILKRADLVKPRKKQPRRPQQLPRPYPIIPGVLVQADTKFLPAKYQYSFLDAASRFADVFLDKKHCMQSSVKALRKFQLPIPIQTIQTDNGKEFQELFQNEAHRLGYKTRFTRYSSPEENGRVERFHRTIDEEFYNRISSQANLEKQLRDYLHYYNYERPHLALKGKSPYQYIKDLQMY